MSTPMGPSNYYTLVLAHGIVMALAFLWFMPIAIVAAKFFRPVSVATTSDKLGNTTAPAWKVVHVLSMVTSAALVIAGFTLGYYASGNSFQVGTMNAHFIIGLTVFIGVLLQAFSGPIMTIFYQVKRMEKRPALNYLHMTFGYLITLLGVSNIWLGLIVYGSPHYLYGLWIAAVAVWVVLYFSGIPLRKAYERRQLEHRGRLEKETSPY